jgi:hypothetical protein
VLRQQLEQLANRLRGAQPSAALAEHTARLLTFAVILLGQHRVNDRGRCRVCSWSRWRWQLWHRRSQCTVCCALAFALGQSLDVVWWQLLTSMGRKCSLMDVREWMTQREQQARPANPTVLAEHNRAAPLPPPPEQAGPAMTDAPSPSPDPPSSPAPDKPG